MTTRCHSVLSLRSPVALSRQVSDVATRKLTTGRPSCIRRTSGSAPRLPTRMTLFTLPAITLSRSGNSARHAPARPSVCAPSTATRATRLRTAPLHQTVFTLDAAPRRAKRVQVLSTGGRERRSSLFVLLYPPCPCKSSGAVSPLFANASLLLQRRPDREGSVGVPLRGVKSLLSAPCRSRAHDLPLAIGRLKEAEDARAS